MAETSDQISNSMFGTEKRYDLGISGCTAFLHFEGRTNVALAVHLAMLRTAFFFLPIGGLI